MIPKICRGLPGEVGVGTGFKRWVTYTGIGAGMAKVWREDGRLVCMELWRLMLDEDTEDDVWGFLLPVEMPTRIICFIGPT